MNKPEKKDCKKKKTRSKFEEPMNPIDAFPVYALGYNQACDDWEKWYKETYDKPLHDLTPMGSEFVDNPVRCFAYIKERITEGFKAKKDLVLFKKRLPSEREIEGIAHWSNCRLTTCGSYTRCSMNNLVCPKFVAKAIAKRIRSLMAHNKSGDFDFSKLKKVDRGRIEAKLFQIIDDIDTASDMFKPPMNSFYKYVMKKVKEARKYVVSDGYELYYKEES